ncbi:DnaA regulatory inactivator Hda [Alcaligenaceae bacterium CGII-47]|nr:DnaA regulatory inactivator Hda [Alcaligenaceae bacterium CGII-47]
MSQQLLLDILPASAPTLENFVVGSNGAVIQSLQTLSAGRAIYLWGGTGSGRSHLLRACAQGTGGVYFNAQSSPADILALATGTDSSLMRVAVDDVDQLSVHAQAALFALYNRWRERAATPQAFALLVSGGTAPRSMSLREDLRSRLGWDLVYRLEQLSDADRAAALRAQAQVRGLLLSEDVLSWILTHYARDMGRLTALIDALDRYSLARHRSITLPLLRDLLAHPLHTMSSP